MDPCCRRNLKRFCAWCAYAAQLHSIEQGTGKAFPTALVTAATRCRMALQLPTPGYGRGACRLIPFIRRSGGAFDPSQWWGAVSWSRWRRAVFFSRRQFTVEVAGTVRAPLVEIFCKLLVALRMPSFIVGIELAHLLVAPLLIVRVAVRGWRWGRL